MDEQPEEQPMTRQSQPFARNYGARTGIGMTRTE